MLLEKYTEIDGIKIFDDQVISESDYNPTGLDNLYQAEEKHFWFLARKEFILSKVKKYVSKTAKVMEVGAGTGNVTRYFKQHGYSNLSVGEMHLGGLKYAQNYGIHECYKFNILQNPFKDEFDAVCMFDVLEHIEEDNLTIKNVHVMLKNKGYMVLTVPAHRWLWNREDKIAGHKRRYTKKELITKLKNNNFEIIEARYFFMTIVPLLFLRVFLSKDNDTMVSEEEHEKSITMNPLLNQILLFFSRIENKINSFVPNVFGGSLFIIARKNDTI